MSTAMDGSMCRRRSRRQRMLCPGRWRMRAVRMCGHWPACAGLGNDMTGWESFWRGMSRRRANGCPGSCSWQEAATAWKILRRLFLTGRGSGTGLSRKRGRWGCTWIWPRSMGLQGTGSGPWRSTGWRRRLFQRMGRSISGRPSFLRRTGERPRPQRCARRLWMMDLMGRFLVCGWSCFWIWRSMSRFGRGQSRLWTRDTSRLP